MSPRQVVPARPPSLRSFLAPGVAALLLALSVGAGCSRKVGDGCTTSADCDPTGGTRTCDMAQPGGYCIVEGCDARSCPEDSVCVRFFPEPFLTKPCTSDADCDAIELCLVDAGLCTRRSLEKRVCVQSCGGNGDCRGGYECRSTGMGGAIALTLTSGEKRSYCAPDDKM